MQISRLPNTATVRAAKPQQTPPPEQPKDQFASTPPQPAGIGKKMWATASLTGTVGMFVGARWGNSLGHPALGFAIGTLVGGVVGLALSSFAYSGKPS